MINEFDTTIKITFHTDDGVPANILFDAISNITTTLRQIEEQQLVEFLAELSQLESTTIDAIKYRFNTTKRNEGLQIRYGEKGSLVLVGAVSAVSLWIVDKTLGETIKDAWKESEAHEKLKSILTKNKSRNEKIIAEKTRKNLKHLGASVSNIEEGKIEVDIPKEFIRAIPTPSEIARFHQRVSGRN